LFWTGAVLSNSGTWIQNVTVPFVVFSLTGSASTVAVAAAAQLVPIALLGPLGGALADRYQRRSVLLVTQSAAALVAVMFWLVWITDSATTPVVIGLVAVLGMVTGLNVPSWQAFVSELVPRETLLNAVTLNSTQFNAARAFGPALGGLVLGTLGPGAAFLLNAVSFGAVIGALMLIRVPTLLKEGSGAGVVSQFAGAVRFAVGHRGILTCMLAVSALGVLGTPVISLVVVFAERVFEVEGLGYGMLAAAIGIGSLLAAPVVAGPLTAVARSRLVLGAIVVYGVALTAFALSPFYGLALAFLLVAGAGYLPIAATLNTTIQLQVTEALRGKVLALYIMVFTLSIPVGTLVQGSLAESFGAPGVTAVAGILFAAAGVALWRVGLLAHLDDEAPEPTVAR
jgi:MFS family permease